MTGDGPDGGRTAPPQVPDAAAKALYRELLAGGGLFHPAEVPAGDAVALEQLRAAGLVVQQQGYELWTVVDPRAAAARISAQLRSAGMDLLVQADAQPGALTDLAAAYEGMPRPAAGNSVIQQLHDLTQIQQRVEQAAAESRWEILVAGPGPRHQVAADQAKETARGLVGRGVAFRVLYQSAARQVPAVVEYAAYASRLGVRFRVLDEPFLQTMIFDRRVAVVGSPGTFHASFIEDPVLVDLVVDQFERDWARAERVRWDAPRETDPLVPLLAQGLTQRAIAKRLRLSERTVATQIARLREEYDAETLFQLGWQIRGEQPDS
ncbi:MULTISPECIES: LuxR family transcriptional regulator [Kitasatospora]|uniref:LuxR family transcriptional regulator n=1 Tax=Kitasatospora TaxID=2063 RepID=UPI000CB99A49|nr:LuxR family transcriptional regulator [Kitasatospora sp. GP30]MDH6138045.1 hypothetical protein [Kitasatospora sp. GP30]